MKKARLKINYVNGNIEYKKGEVISDYHQCYLRKATDILGLNNSFVESNPDIFEIFETPNIGDRVVVYDLVSGCQGAEGAVGIITDKKQIRGLFSTDLGFNIDIDGTIWRVNGKWKLYEKSAEELANELGFKVGDKVWNIETEFYLGEIKSFSTMNTNQLYFDVTTGNTWTLHNKITNKVAIHCPTKEDFEFIYYKLYNKHDKFNYFFNVHQENSIIGVNKQEYWHLKYSKDYLILSIDEYMQSQGIKPIFVTEDKVNVWYEKVGYAVSIKDNRVWRVIINNNFYNHLTDIKVFSTEQAAQQYLENSKILFYTEDYADGSFPVKSCGNCLHHKSEYCIGSGSLKHIPQCIINVDMINKYTYWQGELKGGTIYKGNKCWRVWINFGTLRPEISYDDFTCKYEENANPSREVKYFSNETNARNYFAQLQEQNNPKVESTVLDASKIIETFSKIVNNQIVEIDIPEGYEYDHQIGMNLTTMENYYCKHIYFKKK
jgi:hypothetical protein